jgi:hypothetical protein
VKGARRQCLVICLDGNSYRVTRVRQIPRTARPLNADAESSRGALSVLFNSTDDLQGLIGKN